MALQGATQYLTLGGFRLPPKIGGQSRQYSGDITINSSTLAGDKHLTVGTNQLKTDVRNIKGRATATEVSDIKNPIGTRKVNLPNLPAAINYQQNLLQQRDVGRYRFLTNSCFTHTCNVLRQGGLSRSRSLWETTNIYFFDR